MRYTVTSNCVRCVTRRKKDLSTFIFQRRDFTKPDQYLPKQNCLISLDLFLCETLKNDIYASRSHVKIN